MFLILLDICLSGNAGSDGNMTLPTRNAWGLQFLLFIVTILVGVKWYSLWFGFAFSWWLMTLSIFWGMCVWNSDLSFQMGARTTVFDHLVFNLSSNTPSLIVFSGPGLWFSWFSVSTSSYSYTETSSPSSLLFKGENLGFPVVMAHALPWGSVADDTRLSGGMPALLLTCCVNWGQHLHLSVPWFLHKVVVKPISFHLPSGFLLFFITLIEGLCNSHPQMGVTCIPLFTYSTVIHCPLCVRRGNMAWTRQKSLPLGSWWVSEGRPRIGLSAVCCEEKKAGKWVQGAAGASGNFN